MPKPRPEYESDRYASVIQVSDEPNPNKSFDAVAYGPEEDCWICEKPGCSCWELYDGEVDAGPDGEFDEHGAVTAVSLCREPHAWEPRDEAGALIRP